MARAAIPQAYYKLDMSKGSHKKKKSQVPNGSFIE